VKPVQETRPPEPDDPYAARPASVRRQAVATVKVFLIMAGVLGFLGLLQRAVAE
jgi:hypothetical protein